MIHKMDNEMIDVALLYAFSVLDEKLVDNILEEELSSEKKIETIMSLDTDCKRMILIKLGFSDEFLKTI